MTRPTLERLDAEIAVLERELEPGLQRLRTLKRLRRPLAAAAAASAAAATKVKARKRQDRNDRIASAYGMPGDRIYGSRLELARQHRLSVRTISRAVEGVAAPQRAGWAYRIKPRIAARGCYGPTSILATFLSMMQTKATRCRPPCGRPRTVHDTTGAELRYPSDLTDEEWAFIEPLIPPARRGGNKRTVDERQVVNGLMFILGTGCRWRSLPKDLPPRSTVNRDFCQWSHDRTLDRLHHALHVQCRERDGREASPTAAIIDSQSVKSAEKGGSRTRVALMPGRRSKARSGTSWSIRRAC